MTGLNRVALEQADGKTAVMEIRPVDPRDTQWEVDAQAYRAHFWDTQTWACEETRVTGVADVAEVLDWAAGYAGVREIVVYLELTSGLGVSARRPGLVRLSGRDPNADT